MKTLVTGSSGFIAGYIIEELLKYGHKVIGIDNLKKYGKIRKSYDRHKNFKFVKGDVKNCEFLKKQLSDCDHLIAGAAMIGGIPYFHEFAYDLISENEKIIASTFDAAIHSFKKRKLKKVTVISSSMVFESAKRFPTKEGDERNIPPPKSTYGFQKLSCEYFAQGAYEQYNLPFTIIRPFNAVGIGESKTIYGKNVLSGNIKLAMSHVVPDLVQKILKEQNPLRIFGSGKQIRNYTYAGDIAEAIRISLTEVKAKNTSINISTDYKISVLALAKKIWVILNPSKKFKYICEKPYKYDVQRRIPSINKAKKILNFSAKTSLDVILQEVIPWVKQMVKEKKI